jgi:hypothetical protein
LAQKNTFRTSPNTYIHAQKWRRNLENSIKTIEVAIFKNSFKKTIKTATLTAWRKDASYGCCSSLLFLDFLKRPILINSISSDLNQFIIQLLYFIFFEFWSNTFATHLSTCFYDKNSLSNEINYDAVFLLLTFCGSNKKLLCCIWEKRSLYQFSKIRLAKALFCYSWHGMNDMAFS